MAATWAQSAELSLPKIELELVEDLSPPDQNGFLRLVRRRYRAKYPDGSQSPAVPVRRGGSRLPGRGGDHGAFPHTQRSAARLPTQLGAPAAHAARPPARSTLHGERFDGLMWELPAGMIERAELSLRTGCRAPRSASCWRSSASMFRWPRCSRSARACSPCPASAPNGNFTSRSRSIQASGESRSSTARRSNTSVWS